jgi:hypothetical protein
MHNGAEEINLGAAEVWYNAGIRFHNWELVEDLLREWISILSGLVHVFLNPIGMLTWFLEFQVVYTIGSIL